MKTHIFCLFFLSMVFFVTPVHGTSVISTTEIIETASGKSETSFSTAAQDHGPRKKKKNKKKRKTYLDRKVKMRNGHSCPSF